MYAKTDGSNNITTYPYDISNLRIENPNTSFTPNALTLSDVRSEYKVVEVQAVEAPVVAGKKAVEGTPALDGAVWKQSWSSVNLTADEKAEAAVGARRAEYGSVDSQLEYIVENGIAAFITRQEAIKTNNPKS